MNIFMNNMFKSKLYSYRTRTKSTAEIERYFPTGSGFLLRMPHIGSGTRAMLEFDHE